MKARHFLLAVISALVMQMALPGPASASRKTEIKNLYPAMEKEFSYRDFDFIKTSTKGESLCGRGAYVSGVYDIKVVKSDHYKVVMRIWDRDDIEYFDIRKDGNVLELLSSFKKYPYHSRADATPQAEVTIYTPIFSGAALDSGHKMSIEGGKFSGKSLSINLSGIAKFSGLSGRWDNARISVSGGVSLNDISVEAGNIKILTSGAGVIEGDSSFKASSMSVDMSGGSKMTLQTLDIPVINASLAGASVLSSGDVNAEELKATISGGASARLSGAVSAVNVSLSGAAVLDISGTGNAMSMSGCGGSSLKSMNFSVKEASVSLSGASSAELTVTEKLTMSASISARIDYYGSPKTVINNSPNIMAH